MSSFDPRIEVEKSHEKVTVSIQAYRDSSKQTLLIIWALLWTSCGVYILYLLFSGSAGQDMRSFLIIYLGFWAYFEYKVIYAYRWRSAGKELIEIGTDRLSITRLIGNRGIPRHYSLDYIKNVRIFEDTSGGFIKTMNDSYWVVSGDRLAFDFQGKLITFAMQIPESDASALASLIKHEVTTRRKD